MAEDRLKILEERLTRLEATLARASATGGDLSLAASDGCESRALRSLQSISHAAARFRSHARAEPDIPLRLSFVEGCVDAARIFIRRQQAAATHAPRVFRSAWPTTIAVCGGGMERALAQLAPGASSLR